MSSVNLRFVDFLDSVVTNQAVDWEIPVLSLNASLIHQVYCAEMSAKRQGTVSVKTRAEVTGSGRKPWKQKGTGRARVGAVTSPIWRGGGIIFGPKMRDYSYSVPKKMRRMSLIMLLSRHLNKGTLTLCKKVTSFCADSPKTSAFEKNMLSLIANKENFDNLKNNSLVKKKRRYRLMFISSSLPFAEESKEKKAFESLCKKDNKVSSASIVKRFTNNIPWVTVLSYNQLSTASLFYADEIFIDEDVLKPLSTFFKN